MAIDKNPLDFLVVGFKVSWQEKYSTRSCFEAMAKTMASLKENLQMARICATNSDDTDRKEMEEIYDAINRTDDLEKEINSIQKK